MILNKKQIEIESYGFSENDIEYASTIDETSIAAFFKMFTEGFYQDAIGSIIREITSNCIDANTESGSNEPILITFEKNVESDNYCLSFKDNGIGLSPDRIDNVYRKFLMSTKKTDKNAIGMYGVGSKSVFAYRRESGEKYFFIETVANSIKYLYLYEYKGAIPKLNLLSQNETNEPSGTVIKLDIDNQDYSKVITKLQQQCSYFRNVFINHKEFDNEFIVYEKEHFVFRNKDQYSHNIHICYGEVPYPINFNLIGNEFNYDLPIAVKFKLGELEPTGSRENIVYDSETINLIRKKIKLAVDELLEMYDNQVKKINSIDDYLIYNKSSFVKFGEDVLELKDSKFKIKRKVRFEGLENVPLLPENLFFEYDVVKYDNYNRRKYTSSVLYNTSIISDNRFTSLLFSKNKISIDKYNLDHHFRRNRFVYIVIQNCNSYREICNRLGLRINTKPKFYHTFNRELDEKENKKRLKREYLEFDKNKNLTYHTLGKAKIIYNFRKVVKNYINSRTSQFHVLSEEDKQELIKQERRERQRNNDKTQIFYKVRIGGSRYEDTISNLSKFRIVFYVLDSNNDEIIKKLKDYENLLTGLKWKDKIKFVILNQTNYNKCKKLSNLIHINNFFDLNYFHKHFVMLKLKSEFMNAFNCHISHYILRTLSKYYYEIQTKLNVEFSEYDLTNYSYYIEEINNVIERNKSEKFHIEQKIKEFKHFYSKIGILEYVNAEIPEKYLAEIVKNLKITKLNSNLYGSKS